MPTTAKIEIEKMQSVLKRLKPQANAYYKFAIHTRDSDKARKMLSVVVEIKLLLSDIDKILSSPDSTESYLEEKLLELRENDIIRLAEEFQL